VQSISYDESPEVDDYDVLIPMNVDFDSTTLISGSHFIWYWDWLYTTIKFLLYEIGASVVVRQHPVIRRLDIPVVMVDRLIQDFGNNPRFKFISCNDQINTYKLLNHIKVVLPYTSTVGVEAGISGKTVIMENNCYYSEMPWVIKAEGIVDYYECIAKALQSDPLQTQDNKDAALLCFYYAQICNRQSTPFTPIQINYDSWTQMDIMELSRHPTVHMYMNAIIEGTPVAELAHRRIMSESLL
jgi:hypothetical protein